MTLYRFLAAFILVCYSQFCFCKTVVHSPSKTFIPKKKKKKLNLKKKETNVTQKTESLINNSSDEKQNEKNNDDTFFSRLIKLDIPEKFKLKEIIVGNQSAPKNLIIYFSYTCPHCREFHMKEFPKFKHKYIDTGKIKVEFRNYIDDQGAYEAAQIIRCICKDSINDYGKLSELVLQKQKEWLHSDDPANFLIKIFTEEGINENEVRACLKRTDIGAGLMLEQKRAMNDLQLISMPSFINDKGQKHVGTITCDELVQFCGL